MAKPSHIEVERHPKFDPLYELPEGTNLIILIGGRGGMKTYEASKYIAFSSTIRKKRSAVYRDEQSTIRDSILNEIFLRYETANENGVLDRYFEKTQYELKERSTGKLLVFTKGLRASSNAKKANLKGVSDVDIAVLEEAEDIRDEDKFNTLLDSLRKDGVIVIVILNTPDINHFLIKRYFHLSEPAIPKGWTKEDVEGFFEITPKKLPGFVCIQTSYEDNEHLPQHIVDRYKGYGDPTSHLYNPFYFKTAIKGWASTGRKGQILTKVKPIKLKDYMALPFKEVYGQDFGTASPAGLVGVKFDKNNCYCRQINYLPMNTLSLAKLYATLGFNERDKIYADDAEPDTIAKLKKGYSREELPPDDFAYYPKLSRGFFIEKADKGLIKDGISAMTSLNLFAVEESTDLWNEIYNWVYAVDKNGVPTDEPIDDYNHLIDPWRYVVTKRRPNNQKNLNQFATAFG